MDLAERLWVRSQETIPLIRFRPFDVSTPEGRSRERHRRVALTALASASAKGVSVLTAMISVPLAIKYLGTERYGLWMTISSVIAILGFADLGMGNGLLNMISQAYGKDDREMAREYVSSAFFMLCGIALTLAAIFIAIYPRVPWPRVFNVSSAQAVVESGPAMAVFAGCFLLNIPLGIVQRVQIGYQEGFANSLWQGIGNLLGLAGVLLMIYLQAGLPWLVLAMAAAPVLATTLNAVVLFGFKRPWLWPNWGSATGKAARRILQLGVLFFALQVAVALAYSSDNIVTAQVLGPEAVTQYSVAMKLFSIAPMILGMVLTPLWPAYGEAITRGDVAWVKKTLVRSLVLTLLVTGLLSVLLVLFGGQIVRLWVGPEILPPFLLLLGLGIWMVIMAAGNAVAMFLNGAGIVRFQVICATLMTAGAILGKVFLAQRIGIPGIVWGTIIAYTVFVVIPLVILIPRLLSTMTRSIRETTIA